MKRLLLFCVVFTLSVVPFGNGGNGTTPTLLGEIAFVTPAFAQVDTDCADYGDAPDGFMAGYGAPYDTVFGTFPSYYDSDGARNLSLDQSWCEAVAVEHVTWGAIKAMYRTDGGAQRVVASVFNETEPQEWLGSDGPNGASVSYEYDSEQVDLDQYDDGVSPLAYNYACNPGILDVEVCVNDADGGRYGPEPEKMLYINVLCDWNKDGQWGGQDVGFCPVPVDEWAVRNYAVDPSTWPAGQDCEVIPITIDLGRPGNAWLRVTLTYGETIPTTPEWTGTGQFASGETEDHLILLYIDGPTN